MADETDSGCGESREANLCVFKNCETVNNSTCHCYEPLFKCLAKARCSSNGKLWNTQLDACISQCDPIQHCGIEFALNDSSANTNFNVFSFAAMILVVLVLIM